MNPFVTLFTKLGTEAKAMMLPAGIAVFGIAVLIKLVTALSPDAARHQVSLVSIMVYVGLGMMATGIIMYVAGLGG
jgi:hypothetical protein